VFYSNRGSSSHDPVNYYPPGELPTTKVVGFPKCIKDARTFYREVLSKIIGEYRTKRIKISILDPAFQLFFLDDMQVTVDDDADFVDILPGSTKHT